MNITVGQMSIVDIVENIKRKDFVINRDYQRQAGVWPDSARTYFIDTILEGYPFPKIYIYQVFNEKSNRPIKEVVDGQQRVTTILDFMENKFKLTSASHDYKGMYYRDLDDEKKREFMSYHVETSTILTATRSELLEMFRRINAYNAPLSPAEKRHATYQGAFKWFVVEQADKYSPLLESFKVHTSKQLSRMADAEYISDLVVALEKGIVAKSAKNIDNLYKKYERTDEKFEDYTQKLYEFFQLLTNELAPIKDSFMMKSYALHSLFCAYCHVKYGLPNVEALTEIVPVENVDFDFPKINNKLLILSEAHENQEDNGVYADYVKSCLSSTTKLPQRRKRFSILVNVLTQ